MYARFTTEKGSRLPEHYPTGHHQSLIHNTNLAIINLQVTELDNIPILSVFLVPEFDVGLSDGMV